MSVGLATKKYEVIVFNDETVLYLVWGDDFMTVCFSNLIQSKERSGRLKKNLRGNLGDISGYYNRKIPRG